MNKTRKIIMSSIFIILSLFLLFVSIQERNREIKEEIPYQGFFMIDDQKLGFDESLKKQNIYHILENEKQVEISLPQCREDETWIVNRTRDVKQEVFVSDETYILFTIKITDQDLKEISFRKVKMKDVEKNPNDFDIKKSFELNLTFDYEDGMKNVFEEKKIVLKIQF